jgi:hypothetical protein
VFLVADESCDFSVVAGTRAAGHDVAAITETMSGAADEQVIELANSPTIVAHGRQGFWATGIRGGAEELGRGVDPVSRYRTFEFDRRCS